MHFARFTLPLHATNKKKKAMKNILITLLMLCATLAVSAQNDWEVPDEPTPTAPVIKDNPDQKYLEGAVPVVNGKVVFEKTILAPGKSADEIYGILLNYTERMTRGGNQFEQSRIVMQDTDKHQFVGDFLEWLVFTNRALVLDRTRLRYYLIVSCADGQANVKMTRISYLYEEERDPQQYTAEEWITDEEALNKKHDKLYHANGKFRKKTIDRKDFIFNKFEEILNK